MSALNNYYASNKSLNFSDKKKNKDWHYLTPFHILM